MGRSETSDRSVATYRNSPDEKRGGQPSTREPTCLVFAKRKHQSSVANPQPASQPLDVRANAKTSLEVERAEGLLGFLDVTLASLGHPESRPHRARGQPSPAPLRHSRVA